MNKCTVFVAGATGLFGSTLVPCLRAAGITVVTHARSKNADFLADLTNKNEVFAMLDKVRPGVIINLVGLTSVERCEIFPNEAYLANTKVVENIAQWISGCSMDSHLIQISTDHVYDEMRLNSEKHVALKNYYAFSKYAGELAAIQVPSTILRTNFIGRSKVNGRESLTDWVYNSVTSGKSIEVLSDVFFSPLSMTILAELIQIIIEKKTVGIFNLGAHDGMSKADLDVAFCECLGLPTNSITYIESSKAPFLKTYRPKDMRMNCSKFENTFVVKLPSLSSVIEQVAEEYS